MKESLYQSLRKYGESDFYPFHMPGHKRSPQSGVFSEWYQCDITEIDGFDNLHQPEGILLDAQKRAAELFGSEETYFLINGSTAGILSAVSAIGGRAKKLIMARNCHKAVYHAVFLNHLEPEYVYPSVIEEYGLADGITTEQIKDKLIQIADEQEVSLKQVGEMVAGIVLTSPTYDGILSDVEGIVRLAHEFQIPVIVDQAHGAHFGFHHGFPVNAMAQGADLVIQSVHKTLPAPTQTALLHCNGKLVDRILLRRYLQIYQTSSPSYLFMAGIDACTELLQKEGMMPFERLLGYRSNFHKQIQKLKNIKIYPSMQEKGQNVTSLWEPGIAEPGRFVISVRGTGLTGHMLYDSLRKNYHLQMEMCGIDYVVAILSIMDEWEGFNRLAKALLEIDEEIGRNEALKQEHRDEWIQVDVGGQREVIPLSEAFTAEYEVIKLKDAIGRAVYDFINLYPPGIPLLTPGECLDENIYHVISGYLKKNYSVQGIDIEPIGKEAIIKVIKRRNRHE